MSTNIVTIENGQIVSAEQRALKIQISGKPSYVEAATSIIEREFMPLTSASNDIEQGLQRDWLVIPPDPQPAQIHFEEWLKEFVPEHLHQNWYWRPVLFIFTQQPYLREHIPACFDFKKEKIDMKAMKRLPLSSGLAYLVDLALHLFNSSNPLPGLKPLSNLDRYNYQLAIEAINMRFNH